jgi:hypothetical protein
MAEEAAEETEEEEEEEGPEDAVFCLSRPLVCDSLCLDLRS